MRAKQATRGLERYWKVRTRLVLPSIAPPRGKNFFEGKRGRGEVDIDSSKSEQRQEEDEVYEASIVATILIINNWKPLRF